MLDQTPNPTAGDTRQVVRLSQGQPTSDGAGVKLNRVIGNQLDERVDAILAKRRWMLARGR